MVIFGDESSIDLRHTRGAAVFKKSQTAGLSRKERPVSRPLFRGTLYYYYFDSIAVSLRLKSLGLRGIEAGSDWNR